MSLAKAGVVCSLPARTSILAAANPTGGHYNKAKTVSENLKSVSCDVELCCYIIIIVFSTFAFRMNSALLSRFDLVSVCRIQYQSSAHTHTHTHTHTPLQCWYIQYPSPLPPSPSLSFFLSDQVFILLDKPDEETDSLLSEHVMALHAGAAGRRERWDKMGGV